MPPVNSKMAPPAHGNRTNSSPRAGTDTSGPRVLFSCNNLPSRHLQESIRSTLRWEPTGQARARNNPLPLIPSPRRQVSDPAPDEGSPSSPSVASPAPSSSSQSSSSSSSSSSTTFSQPSPSPANHSPPASPCRAAPPAEAVWGGFGDSDTASCRSGVTDALSGIVSRNEAGGIVSRNEAGGIVSRNVAATVPNIVIEQGDGDAGNFTCAFIDDNTGEQCPVTLPVLEYMLTHFYTKHMARAKQEGIRPSQPLSCFYPDCEHSFDWHNELIAHLQDGHHQKLAHINVIMQHLDDILEQAKDSEEELREEGARQKEIIERLREDNRKKDKTIRKNNNSSSVKKVNMYKQKYANVKRRSQLAKKEFVRQSGLVANMLFDGIETSQDEKEEEEDEMKDEDVVEEVVIIDN